MPSAATDALRTAWVRHRSLIVPALMAASVLVIVVPLPAWLLDLLLSANITIAVVILLTTMYVEKPLDFSVFPTLLLATTLSRLVLNVASTRLILTRGAIDGADAAGRVIGAFGDFVADGQIVVGLIIFSILIAIQFLVLTKGATRIGEVAARFALDGLPGKQMAIDADLNAGAITGEVAARRREELLRQADFYGAMDGASRFVRGDAIASVVITLINIVGGIYIGTVDQGMYLSEAANVFTKLTIGDGLVTQVPAFLISLAAGLLVTRSSVSSNLPRDVLTQTFIRPEALGVAVTFLAALAFTGLPRMPLLVLAGGLLALRTILSREQHRSQAVEPQSEAVRVPDQAGPKLADELLVAPLELDLGYGLIRLADASSGGDLLDRVTRIRQKMAQEMGIVLPKVRIRDDIRLGQRQYQIKIQDATVGGGEIYSDGLLAIGGRAASGAMRGVATIDPAFGRPALWIEGSDRERAESLECHIAEPAAVIGMHLAELVRRHSDELLSRDQVHQLLDNLRQKSPRLVDDVVPGLLKPAQVHAVLCRLLKERVSVRNLEVILETLGSIAFQTTDPHVLTEGVREALARGICQQYRDRNRLLRVVTLDPEIEEMIAKAISQSDRGPSVHLPPHATRSLVGAISAALQALSETGCPDVVLTNAHIRAAVKQLTAAALPSLAVLSWREITHDTQVEAAGQVTLEAIDPAPAQVMAHAA